MAKSTSLTDFIGTVAGIDDRITWNHSDFTVDLTGLADDAAMLAAARYALNIWSVSTGFTFTEAVDTRDEPVDMLFDNEMAGAFAQSSYYIDGGERGYTRAFINVSKTFQDGFPVGQRWGIGDYGVQTFVHEIGHALGLRHPGDYNAGQGPEPITYENSAIYEMDTYQYSIMSYFSQRNYGDASYAFVATPMLIDYAAIVELYGSIEANLGNTRYGGPGLYDFSIRAAFTISDSDGTDVIDLSGQTLGARLNLKAGSFSDVNGLVKNLAIAFDTVIENAVGGSGNDVIVGNAAANHLSGGGGDDSLYGGRADILSGGAGQDRLIVTQGVAAVDGGSGNDMLFLQGGGTFTFTSRTFTDIERVHVGGGSTLDLSAVSESVTIVSRSTPGHGVTILGTSDADRIHAGAGGDTIEGGSGGDKLFAGSGADAFRFASGFSRDNLYGFDAAADRIAVDIAGVEAGDLVLRPLGVGDDTLVTFRGAGAGNKIILHDVTVAQLEQQGLSELFTFGA